MVVVVVLNSFGFFSKVLWLLAYRFLVPGILFAPIGLLSVLFCPREPDLVGNIMGAFTRHPLIGFGQWWTLRRGKEESVVGMPLAGLCLYWVPWPFQCVLFSRTLSVWTLVSSTSHATHLGVVIAWSFCYTIFTDALPCLVKSLFVKPISSYPNLNIPSVSCWDPDWHSSRHLWFISTCFIFF